MTRVKWVRGASLVALVASLLAVLVGLGPHHRAIAEKPQEKEAAMKVVCFGDSITGPKPREAYRDKYLKYADLLQLMLEARVGVGQVTVVNCGYAGDKTYADPAAGSPGAINRFQEDVLDAHPDIVTILISGNDDRNTAEDHARTRKNLDAMATQAQQANIKVLFLQYHVLPNPEHPETAWTTLDDNNDLIAEIATAHKAPILNMADPMREALKTTTLGALVNLQDGVHLNPTGEMVYARSIFAKLVELGWAPPTK